MPRRPRKLVTKTYQTKPVISRAQEPKAKTLAESKSRPMPSSFEEVESDRDEDFDAEVSEGAAYSSDGSDLDLDAPRVSQWVDEDELDDFDNSDISDDDEGSEHEPPSISKQPSQKKLVRVSFA
jgi:hypothetical protein